MPPVDLELLFARPYGADAAHMLGKMRPRVREARVQRFHLGELHLDAGLVGARVLCKNVEDELRPVDHLALHDLLDVAYLARGQLSVDDHGLAAVLLHEGAYFHELARSDIC